MQSFLCTEFLDYLARETRRSGIAADLPACGPGLCTGVGHVQALADAAAARTGTPPGKLLRQFGATLFAPLVRRYPAFFVGIESTIDLLRLFDAHIAAEVEKLAPGVRLPTVAVVGRVGRAVEVLYRYPDGLADLAEGLLHGSLQHFSEPLTVHSRPVSAVDAIDGTLFALRPRGGSSSARRSRRPLLGTLADARRRHRTTRRPFAASVKQSRRRTTSRRRRCSRSNGFR
jgi:hypothetical protein